MSELSYINGVLEVRDLTRREVDVRLLAWGEIGEIRDGYESFARGAFAGADPSRIVFRNMHAAVVGRGLELRETEDGAYMTFRVSATPAGDRNRNILSISPRMLGPNLGSGDITPVVDAPGYEPFAGEP